MNRWWIPVVAIPLLTGVALPASGKTLTQPKLLPLAAAPAIALAPAAGKPGETITVSGTGFACHGGKAVAVISFNNVQQGGSAPVACSGTFTSSFRIPDVAIGTYTVSAEGFAPLAASPTDTPVPSPTDTPVPADTATPIPTVAPTATAPATATLTVAPTSTETVAATATNTVPATATATTAVTPTQTPLPTVTPTLAVPLSPIATNIAHATPTSTQVSILPPNLTLTKTADTPSANAGQSIGFTITASNSAAPGTGTARNVALNDPLPSRGETTATWSINPPYVGPGTCAITGQTGSQTLSCAFGDLAAGAGASVHVTEVSDGNGCGTYTNTATLTSSNAPSKQATASTVVQCPQLTLSKTADKTPVNANSNIGFTITAGDASGSGTATGVTLSDPLPGNNGLNWSINPAYGGPGNCAITGASRAQSLNCSFGNLAPGSATTVHIVSGTSCATSGTVSNTASVMATNGNGPVLSSADITVNYGCYLGFARANPIPAGSPNRHLTWVALAAHSFAALQRTTGAAVVPAGYRFDGDRASVSVTVTAPAAPFTVTQHSTCTPPPAVGAVSHCTITETVQNTSGHTIRFGGASGGIGNHIPLFLQGRTPHAGVGGFHAGGTVVRWSGFDVPPGASRTATIMVTFVPVTAQLRHRVPLSTGLDAIGVDLVSGQQYRETYGTLTTHVRTSVLLVPGTGYGGTTALAAPNGVLLHLPTTGGGAGMAPRRAPIGGK